MAPSGAFFFALIYFWGRIPNGDHVNQHFSLRKLEMAFPYIKAAEDQDPVALVNLASIALADEATLKLAASGNPEPLQAYKDKAYEMDTEEVGQILHFFITASQRFMLAVSGLSPDQINQRMAKMKQTLAEAMDLGSQEK